MGFGMEKSGGGTGGKVRGNEEEEEDAVAVEACAISTAIWAAAHAAPA